MKSPNFFVQIFSLTLKLHQPSLTCLKNIQPPVLGTLDFMKMHFFKIAYHIV